MTPLRKRLIEDMTVRNFAPATQTTYVQQVSLFARHFGQSPEMLGPEEIRSYQVYLAMEKELAPSSICTAVAAFVRRSLIVFGYVFPDVEKISPRPPRRTVGCHRERRPNSRWRRWRASRFNSSARSGSVARV